MKIYSNVFDLAFPSPSRFWVAPNSDFKIGIKIENRGQPYEGDFVLKQGTTTLTADANQTAGFTTYTIKSLGTGSVVYNVEVPDALQKFKLIQVVTDSTVFDIGLSGGGGDVPADVATQTWVNEQISDFITEDALSDYAEESSLTAYATADSLTAYATADSLTAYAEESSLTAYATNESLTAYATADSLTAYATVDSLSAKVGKSATGQAPLVNTVNSVYETDWQTLSANPDANTLYVVLADPS